MLNYEEYKLLMNRQLKKKDVRERVFQDNVIRPFLQVLLTDYDIEPVDVKINSSEHDYTQYCGTYVKMELRLRLLLICVFQIIGIGKIEKILLTISVLLKLSLLF